MRILFVLPEYPPHTGGGIATFYKNIVPELARSGHQVQLLVGSALSRNMPDYTEDGVSVEFLDHNAVSRNLDKFSRYHAVPELQRHLSAAWTAWEQAKKGKGFDVVETTDWGLLFVPWIVEAESPPVVVQLHGSIGQIDFHDPRRGEEMQGCLIRLIEMQLLACADELQTYSKNNASTWQSLTGRDVTYIPPVRQAALPARAPGDGATRGLVVGRIQYWKGPTVLCEALRLLDEDAPFIDWVGRDTTYQDARVSMSGYLAQQYPDVWGKKVIPVGPRSHEEALQLQSQAAFIVVPSTWDVFNYTCIEGMAQARVVLCSEGAGAAGLITSGEDGLTFAASDPVALAESLKRFLHTDARSRSQMGERARQMIETRLAPSCIAAQRITAYESLLRRGKQPMRPEEWLTNAVCPHAPLTERLAFLDRLPLRELFNYTLSRGLKKLFASN